MCTGDFASRVARHAGIAVTHDAKRMQGQIYHRLESAGRKAVFHLYISGATFRSTAAVRHLKAVQEKLFEGQYELWVTDIYQEPHKANAAKVDLVLTLVRKILHPSRELLGIFPPRRLLRLC